MFIFAAPLFDNPVQNIMFWTGFAAVAVVLAVVVCVACLLFTRNGG